MRLLIVEDEIKVARFLERGLREEGFEVDVAGDGEAGCALAREKSYALILLDVLLPKRDGFAVLRDLRAAGCGSPVLMLTARDGVNDRVRGLDLGADDYLVKPFAFAELLARIRALLRRAPAGGAGEFRLGGLAIDFASRKAARGEKRLWLSAREFAVLACLARHAGEVVSRAQLAEQVWENQLHPKDNVIDVTMYHLREKVDREFAAPLIHTVRGAGYVLRESAAPGAPT
jgi:two-component system copper resistance phosphate regulon response regulator CusR